MICVLKIDNIIMEECDKNKRIKTIEEKLKELPTKHLNRTHVESRFVEKMDDMRNIIKLGNLAERVGLSLPTESSYCCDGSFLVKPGELRFSKVLNNETCGCRGLMLRIFLIDDVPAIKFEDLHCGIVTETEQTQMMNDFLSQFDIFYESYLGYLEKETNIKDS
nr:MAG TPA: hypothetical protein [Caudoviricetes sp.]